MNVQIPLNPAIFMQNARKWLSALLPGKNAKADYRGRTL